MLKEIEIPTQDMLQRVEVQIAKEKAARKRTKMSNMLNLAELEKLLNISNTKNSEEQETTALAVETVA